MRRRGVNVLQIILVINVGTLICFGQVTERRVVDQTEHVEFQPLKQKPITYSDDSIEVTLVQEKVNPGKPDWTIRSFLKLSPRTTGSVKIVELSDELAQIDEIRRGANNRLVVSGMIGGAGNAIQIFDLDTAKAVDEFVCYRPAISSNGKYIAFERYYPPHFVDGVESHYAIYDLTKSPEDNDRGDIGRIVYPPGIKNSDDNVGITGRPLHGYSSGFFWNPEKDEFLFADRIESSDGYPTLNASLVLVQIGANGEPRVGTVHLPLKKICPPDSWCPLWIREVRFRSHREPRFAVTFRVDEGSKTIEFSSSDFR